MATMKKKTGRSADASAGASAVKRKAAMSGRKAVNSTKAKVAKTTGDAVSRRYTYTVLANSGDKDLKDKKSGITRQTRPDAKTPIAYTTKKNETNYSSKVQKKLKSKFGK